MYLTVQSSVPPWWSSECWWWIPHTHAFPSSANWPASPTNPLQPPCPQQCAPLLRLVPHQDNLTGRVAQLGLCSQVHWWRGRYRGRSEYSCPVKKGISYFEPQSFLPSVMLAVWLAGYLAMAGGPGVTLQFHLLPQGRDRSRIFDGKHRNFTDKTEEKSDVV